LKLFASLYLDEDVSILVADILRARGFDVITAHDEKMLVLSLSKGWGAMTPNNWKRRFLSIAVFLHTTESITKNSTVKPF